MPLLVDERMVQANSRLSFIRMAMFTLRNMENWRALVDDCEKAMILLAISAISGERFTRGEALEPELRDLRTAFPLERLRQCSISSIAAATGFNRETTRRKVNELIEAGILMRSSNGRLRYRPGFIQAETVIELLRKQLEALVRIANDLVRDGVVIDSN